MRLVESVVVQSGIQSVHQLGRTPRPARAEQQHLFQRPPQALEDRYRTVLADGSEPLADSPPL